MCDLMKGSDQWEDAFCVETRAHGIGTFSRHMKRQYSGERRIAGEQEADLSQRNVSE
jgi:hypothetical protein